MVGRRRTPRAPASVGTVNGGNRPPDRHPGWPALAASAATITAAVSARRTSINAGNNTWVTPHPVHRDRRGRTRTSPCWPRTSRSRAWPHPASTAEQTGHISWPEASRCSTPATCAPTVTTAPPSAPHGPPARSSHGNQREGRRLPRPDDRHGGGGDEADQHTTPVLASVVAPNDASPALHRHPEWRLTRAEPITSSAPEPMFLLSVPRVWGFALNPPPRVWVFETRLPPAHLLIADDKRSRTFGLPGADPTGGGPRWPAVREYPDLRTLGRSRTSRDARDPSTRDADDSTSRAPGLAGPAACRGCRGPVADVLAHSARTVTHR